MKGPVVVQVKDLISDLSRELKKVNADRSLFEARLIVSHILKCRPEDILVNDSRVVTSEELVSIRAVAVRRLQFEPMAYLLGEKEFLGRKFVVDSSVLIPRPETESLVLGVVQWVRERKMKTATILDLGTGSGCVALSIAKELGTAFQITAIDKSESALEIAERNRLALSVPNVELKVGDIFAGPSLKEKFDIIVSNPPYIPSSQIETLQADIRKFEPRLALEGGVEGIDFYEAILRLWKPHLKRPGLIAVETLGPDQQSHLNSKLNLEDAVKIWHDGPHVFLEY